MIYIKRSLSAFALSFCMTSSAYAGKPDALDQFFDNVRRDISSLKSDTDQLVATVAATQRAITLASKYRDQALRDEKSLGLNYAHAKAAYEYGYAVGDINIINNFRLFSESVQYSIVNVDDIIDTGKYAPFSTSAQFVVNWVGRGFGITRDYSADEAYLADAVDDISITRAGARAAQNGRPLSFEDYAKANNIIKGE